MRASLLAVALLLEGCTLLFAPEAPLAECPEEDIVAHYDFETGLSTGTVQDVVGDHDGMIRGRGSLVQVQGPGGTGQAGRFDRAAVVVEDAPAFHLKRGAIQLWVRVDGDALEQGIISRDASEQDLPGHLTLGTREIDGERRLNLRVQPNELDFSACSESPVDSGTWHHVTANFGAPRAELFVDGTRQPDCGEDTPHGIDGNANPWAIGADSGSSDEGESNGLTNYLTGAMDEVVICKRRLRPDP